MIKYVVRRLLLAIPVLVGVSLVTFILLHVVPGDPAVNMLGQHPNPAVVEKLREQLGLNRPLAVQYWDFVSRAAVGDLGVSYYRHVRVMDLILQRLPATATIAVSAMAVGAVLGMTVGIVSAVHQYSVWDGGGMILALSFISAPVFWVGLLAQIVFGFKFPILPISGWDGPAYVVLPAAVLGTRYAASIARYTRSSLLEVIRSDFVRTARAKGLGERRVIYAHALRNALIPVVTVMGMELGGLLTGSILTETIFAIPGLGLLTIDALTSRDMPLVQGTVIFTAFVFVVANLAVDLSYGWLNPRIRYE